jgi:type IV secretion system protein VirD4
MSATPVNRKAKDNPKAKPVKPKSGSQANKKRNSSKKKKHTQNKLVSDIKKKLKKVQFSKVLKKAVPYIVFGYFGNKITYSFRLTTDKNFFMRLVKCLGNLGKAFENIFPSLNGYDLLGGIVTGALIWFVVYIKKKNAKKYRRGYEYGSARWGTEKDIENFMDTEDPDNNIIITQTEFIMLNGRPKKPEYAVNKNVLVIGGSGSGKTRFFVKPNLCQCHCSYVLTDPKGTTLDECGKMLLRNGYKIITINTIDFDKSMHYNPFAYIRSEKDIMKLVTIFMANTKSENSSGGDQFWDNAERLLYMAYIGYIYYECIPEEQNFGTLVDMINASETREDEEDFKNAIDYIFDDLEMENPEHFALLQYKKFKLAAGKTAKSILISCATRLAPFDIKELRELTSYDEMDIEKMATQRTALFMIMSDTDSTFNFIIAMLEAQLFNILCDLAGSKFGGRLPIHVRFILDEFSNIGKIPEFEKIISVIRSREISTCIILQSKAQLKALYKDHAGTIADNCDSQLFLGGRGDETLKELSGLLGKETIDIQTTSESRGQSPSNGTNNQRMGKELMTPDEIAVMSGKKCIFQLRGVRPFLSDKYDITKHKRYKLLSDFNEKNTFDIKEYLSTKLEVKPEQELEYYDCGTVEE